MRSGLTATAAHVTPAGALILAGTCVLVLLLGGLVALTVDAGIQAVRRWCRRKAEDDKVLNEQKRLR